MRCSPSGPTKFRPTTTCRRRSSRFSRARWRSTPAFLEHTDHHVGRLFDTLKDLEILDDTLIYYIFGDNGASAEGTLNGCFNEVAVLNGMGTLETPEFLMSKIDDFGGPDAYNHYAVGWAHAMNTPYQWTKQVASHFGGTRNGTIVHWPKGIKGKGEIRSQFCHVIDIAPTILEAAGIPAPTFVNGIQQAPFEGASMLYAFNDAKAAERRETQYFEMFCNRGIYHKGWTAVTRHGVPWVGSYKRAFDDDVWELYDTNTDWTQSKDLAKEHPKKLAELQRLFLIEATKYSVLPLDDRTFERFNADLAGRPQLIKGNSQILFGGMSRLSEGSLVVTHNKSYSLTAEIEVPKSGANGVIVAHWRQRRRLEPLRAERQAEALLQLLRHRAVLCRRHAADSRRQAPGAHGVQVRRRRPGQGRHGVALRGRQEGRRRAASSRPCRCSSRPTRPATSARKPARRSRRTTVRPATSSAARSTGSRSTWRRTIRTT